MILCNKILHLLFAACWDLGFSLFPLCCGGRVGIKAQRKITKTKREKKIIKAFQEENMAFKYSVPNKRNTIQCSHIPALSDSRVPLLTVTVTLL